MRTCLKENKDEKGKKRKNRHKNKRTQRWEVRTKVARRLALQLPTLKNITERCQIHSRPPALALKANFGYLTIKLGNPQAPRRY
jgi:transcription initiation factor TFIIIB Brf1 subunit/transcription initiation factor TFIIB